MRRLGITLLLLCTCCEGLLNDDADINDQTTAGESSNCISGVSIETSQPNATGQLGASCSPSNEPSNCLDGTYILFADTNECVCIATCSTVGVSQGTSCDESSLYVCQTVTGVSGGPYCIATSWNICGDASGTGSQGTTGSDGVDGTTGGMDDESTTCKPDGLACDDDAECCSQVCFASGCG